MIKKRDFINAIKAMQAQQEKDKSIMTALQAACPESYIIYTTCLIGDMMKLLKHAVDDENDWIEYYINELNFGKKYFPGVVMSNGKNVSLETPEDLWNLMKSEGQNEPS